MLVELSQDELTEIIAAIELLSQWDCNFYSQDCSIDDIDRSQLVDLQNLLIRLKMF